ncbi:MAG: IS256 family transposase [Bacteroidia bacterium]|nr:IS256 family transposase [Bacteroidia bacterium]MDW3651797.1 IS256 family transposase [Bacteroidia bacterium]MDW3652786.1 IS256 family transposase [Bacteroidia bacterium]MDW3652789.1 IS256 family transposase [Bacteroidia bacterium]
MAKEKFDYEKFKEEAREKLQSGGSLLGKEGALTSLLKDFLEESLVGELETHLDEGPKGNRKNGRGKKRVKTSLGEVEISPPRDRDGSFSPKLLPKRKRTLGEDIDRQILALYARGSSYGNIRDYLEEMYGLEVSTAAISRITDKVLPLLQEWKGRALEAVYPIVWMDAIHYKVRVEGRVVTKAVYCVLGLTQEGYKEVMGLYLGEVGGESSKFWLQVLTDLQNRGVEDIFIACIDNLSGFTQAIESIFPKTEVQLCIVHQIRNSKKYLAWNDTRAFIKELKTVYQASNLDLAERNLDMLEANWGKKYPAIIDSWRRNWEHLSKYFQYTYEIRRIIYTTNIVEGFNRQLRKVTKTKGAFTSDEGLMKLLYLVQNDVTKKWTRPVHNWNQTLSKLSIIFGDRLKLDL